MIAPLWTTLWRERGGRVDIAGRSAARPGGAPDPSPAVGSRPLSIPMVIPSQKALPTGTTRARPQDRAACFHC